MARDARVDTYIGNAPEFAQPILERIRAAWHRASPDIEETIKWGIPYFEYRGLVGGMAAFKTHVSLGFRKAKQLSDPQKILGDGSSLSARRIRSLDELPPEKTLVACMREAIALNVPGAPARPATPAKTLPLPGDFLKAMQRNRQSLATFEGFPPSQRREYIEWIVEAKQAATRERRIAQAVEWLAEGKPRHWKYMKRPSGG